MKKEHENIVYIDKKVLNLKRYLKTGLNLYLIWNLISKKLFCWFLNMRIVKEMTYLEKIVFYKIFYFLHLDKKRFLKFWKIFYTFLN